MIRIRNYLLYLFQAEPVSIEDELDQFHQQWFAGLGSYQPAVTQGVTATAMVEEDGATVEVKPYIQLSCDNPLFSLSLFTLNLADMSDKC